MENAGFSVSGGGRGLLLLRNRVPDEADHQTRQRRADPAHAQIVEGQRLLGKGHGAPQVQ